MKQAVLIVFAGLAMSAGLTFAAAWTAGPQDIPGPLSAAHIPKPGEAECSACHSAPGKASPAKCLSCHTEIAARVSAGRGYHRDKADDCAVCHVEHQGREAAIVPLDRAGFDHAETGARLEGAHAETKDCDKCHTSANTLPRAKGRSYLFKSSGCRGCHVAPHPGRQDRCLDCHGQVTWAVERRTPED